MRVRAATTAAVSAAAVAAAAAVSQLLRLSRESESRYSVPLRRGRDVRDGRDGRRCGRRDDLRTWLVALAPKPRKKATSFHVVHLCPSLKSSLVVHSPRGSHAADKLGGFATSYFLPILPTDTGIFGIDTTFDCFGAPL